MKRKVCAGAAALLVLAAMPMPAQFGFGMVEPGPGWWAHLAAEYKEFVDIVQQGRKVYDQTQQMAGFVRSAGNWRGLLNNASASLGMPSLGSDITALTQIKRSNRAAIDILNRISNDGGWQPTAENATLIQMLHLETVKGVMEQNRLENQLTQNMQRIAAIKAVPAIRMDSMFNAEYRQE